MLLSKFNIPYSRDLTLIVVTLVLSCVTLVLGELYPKMLALKKSLLGFIPYDGEEYTLEHNNVVLKIEEVKNKRIERLKICIDKYLKGILYFLS